MLEPLEDRALLATFLVTHTLDNGNNNIPLAGSLRKAIIDANNAPGPDEIDFAAGNGVATFLPPAPLPTITDTVSILGTTQQGSTPNILTFGENAAINVVIDGIIAGANADGLVIATSDCVVSGLDIVNFGGNGILIDGAKATGNYVAGNFIGVDRAGVFDLGNGQAGVALVGNAQNNTIGGAGVGERNLVAGNTGANILLQGVTTFDNTVSNNYIGFNRFGVALSGNDDGVAIVQSNRNTIGGVGPGEGNVISGNKLAGVHITFGSDNVLANNWIGLNYSGAGPLPNGTDGVVITDAPANHIGVPGTPAPNVISGNTNNGVAITGVAAVGNVVADNRIGTDKTGTKAIPNRDGVRIEDASNNTVSENLISGNAHSGVVIAAVADTATGNTVTGNRIGTDLGGTTGLGNLNNGVSIEDASQNTIGGTAPVDRNVISGNGQVGVSVVSSTGSNGVGNLIEGNYIGTDVTGTKDLGTMGIGVSIVDAWGTIVGGTAAGAGNVISGNDLAGIFANTSVAASIEGVLIQGNLIGTDAGGTTAVPNLFGVYFDNGARKNTIGGTAPGSRNIISGNTEGILIADNKGMSTIDNRVAGNYIGTDLTGTQPLGNQVGVSLANGARSNTVGGTTPEARNIIANNSVAGVHITQVANTATDHNVVLGNYVGTDVTGTVAMGNGYGVDVDGGSSWNTIGGTAAGARNVISASINSGVLLDDSSNFGTSNNLVQGNYVGTDVTGTKALGNSGGGIAVRAASNTIGGAAPGAGNLVSGNGLSGILLAGNTGLSNKVLGNRVGTDVTGTLPLGNLGDGITVDLGATSNQIGGANQGAGNIVAFNLGAGVNIVQGNKNLVSGNSLFENGGLGIDLGGNGVSPNDKTINFATGNIGEEAPVLTSAVIQNGVITVTGTYEVVPLPNVPFTLEFYASPDVDNTGFGEGKIFLGVGSVQLDPQGKGSFTATLFNALPAGYYISATATDPVDNTSEFSHAIPLAGPPVPPGITVTPVSGLTTTESGGKATFSVVLDTVPTANVTIAVTCSDITEGFVPPVVLTFTPPNALVPQVVTVTGIDDALSDGDVTYTIFTAPAVSTDLAYSGLNAPDVSVTNVDDEPSVAAQVLVTPVSGLVTTESGGTATFSVVLTTVPTADVTIALSSADITEGFVPPIVVTFTPANALVPQVVTVTGIDDALLDGDVAYTILTAPAVSADPAYSGLDAPNVSVTNLDDEAPVVPQVIVTPVSGLITTEAGGTATFTVALSTVPTADVSIALSSSDAGEGTVSPVVLTFTPANALVPQTVTVKGVDDALIDGDVAYAIVTAPATSADPAYNGLNAADVAITNLDDESAGQAEIVVTPVSGLITTESGGVATFAVVLKSVPTADVSVVLTSNDATEGVATPVVLMFTPASALVPQVVTVKGVDDQVADGAVVYSIVTAPAVSADPNYNGLDAPDVSLTSIDDDQVGITVKPVFVGVTTEAGGTATFLVVLDSEPTADVTIALSSSDPSEATVSPALLTFTPANALVPQLVTVTGVDDAFLDGDVAYFIVTAPAASADPNYSGLDPADAAFTNLDDEAPAVPQVIVTAVSAPVTTEAGGAATFTVVLNVVPAADVSISLSSSDPSEGMASPVVLTFTPANALIPQMVTVTGIDDAFLDGNIPYSVITSATASADPSFNGLNVADLALTNLDDASAGQAQVIVTQVTAPVTTEAGGTATFTIALGSIPSADVSIVLSSSDATEGIATPVVLTFTPSNAMVPQVVTVKGVDDQADDGDVPYSILTAPASSADPAYNGLDGPDLALTNIDDDQAGIVVRAAPGLATTEAGGTATFAVVLASVPTGVVTIALSSSNPAEGTVQPALLTFTPADALVPQVVTVRGIDDSLLDGDVAYTIVTAAAASPDPAYAQLDAPDVAISNLDDDEAGTIQLGGATFSVDESAGSAMIVVTRSGGLAGGMSVDVSTQSGSAHAGADYASALLHLTFAANETSRLVLIPIVDDLLDEADESLTLLLSDPSGGATMGAQATASLTIVDDDAEVQVQADDLSMAEGSDDQPHSASFLVSLSAPSGKPVTVNYTTGDGSATPGADYEGVSGTLTFQPGETVKAVDVPVMGDYLGEAAETFRLLLSGAANATVARAVAIATIGDDDGGVSVSVDDSRTAEGRSAVFLVRLSAPCGEPVTVNFATADGTARGAADYQARGGVLTFQPGETVKEVAVPVLHDRLDEPKEIFGLVLSSPAGATLARSRAVGVIQDVTPPRVAGVQPLGFRAAPSQLRIAFSEALDATRAVRAGNYALRTAGRDGKFGTSDDQLVAIAKAAYDRTLHTVTLTPRHPAALRQDLQLVVNGTLPTALCDLSGNHLDGNGDGRPGGDFTVLVRGSHTLPSATSAARLSAGRHRPASPR